jgi:Mrp family chromosome partitioning ATPase
VLLLDANLRTPSVHTIFQVQQIPGLSDLIEQRATLDEAIHSLQHSGLSILPIGATGEDALALFPAPSCSALIQVLRKEFRFVIVDSPPLLQFVDTTLLIPYADGVVVTVAAGVHRRSEIVEVGDQLDRLKANSIGIVLCEKTGRLSW